MSIFNRVDVYIGNSSSDLNKALDTLDAAKIKYRWRIRNMGGIDRFIPNTDINYSVQYIISVKRKDAETAAHFLGISWNIR